ncbi:MAG TPA: hypothetical protein VIL12_06000 [Acidimicrobiia bacterium]
MAKSRVILVGVAVGLAVVAAACGSGADDSAQTTTTTEPAASSAMGPGLSVSEALASDVSGPLLINGFIVAQSGGTIVLSEALAESFPPQAAGATLIVEGLDLSTIEGLQTHEDVSWTDQQIQILGEVQGGVLEVSTTASA